MLLLISYFQKCVLIFFLCKDRIFKALVLEFHLLILRSPFSVRLFSRQFVRQVDWASQYFREGNWGQKPPTPEEEEANDARPDGLLDVRVWALQPHIQAVPSVFGPLLATATSATQPGGSVAQAAAAAATASAAAAAASSSTENNGGPSHDWLILEAGDGVFYRMSVGPSGWRQRMLPSLDSSNGYVNNADQTTNTRGSSDADQIGVLMSPEEEASQPIDPNTGYPMRDRHQEILISGVAAVATDRFIPGPRGGRGIRGAAGTGRGVATVLLII